MKHRLKTLIKTLKGTLPITSQFNRSDVESAELNGILLCLTINLSKIPVKLLAKMDFSQKFFE